MLFQEALDSDPEVAAATAVLNVAAARLAEATDVFNANHPQKGMLLGHDNNGLPGFIGSGVSPREIAMDQMRSGAAIRALRAANQEHAAAASAHRRIVAEVRRRLILDSGKETHGNGK